MSTINIDASRVMAAKVIRGLMSRPGTAASCWQLSEQVYSTVINYNIYIYIFEYYKRVNEL